MISTAPANTASCASCHFGATSTQGYVFQTKFIYNHAAWAQTPPMGPNEVGISDLAFHPLNAQRVPFLSVKVSTTVKWTNNDDVDHPVVAADGTFNSGVLKPRHDFAQDALCIARA